MVRSVRSVDVGARAGHAAVLIAARDDGRLDRSRRDRSRSDHGFVRAVLRVRLPDTESNP